MKLNRDHIRFFNAIADAFNQAGHLSDSEKGAVIEYFSALLLTKRIESSTVDLELYRGLSSFGFDRSFNPVGNVLEVPESDRVIHQQLVGGVA
jgi:hypothetical protein